MHRIVPKDGKGVDRVIRPACSASRASLAFCGEGGAIRRRYHLVETAPTFRARRGNLKSGLIPGFTSVAHSAGLAIGAHHS